MKIELHNVNDPIVISKEQKAIMKNIVDLVLQELDIVYTKEEILSIIFNLRNKSISLRVFVKTESSDVIEILKNKLGRKLDLGENEPGLSFMSLYKNEISSAILGISNAPTEISFWYKFTESENDEWESNSLYSFDY